MNARLRLSMGVGWLMLAWTPALLAQSIQISGTVYEANTGDALPTVNVTLERAGAIIAGTATDDQGRYQMGGVPAGSYTLFARFIGYQTAQAEVVLGTQPVTVDLRIEPAVLDLEAVEVSASPIQPPDDPSVSLQRVTPEQIRQLPGGAEDVMQALQALPGVLAASDYSNQLIVRGGTPDQNLIILDEIEVFSPYQLSGLASLLNPAVVRNVELYSGAFPAAYGDRLSSVLAVQTRDGVSDRWLGGEVSTNMISANLILEGKTGLMDGSWLVSGRRTYFDTFANTFAQRVGVENEIAFPDFTDVQFKLVLRPARGHQVRFTGLHSEDALDLRPETADFGQQGESSNLLIGDMDTQNTGLGVTWTYVPTANMQVKLLANWYRNKGVSAMTGGLVPHEEEINVRPIDFSPPPPPPPAFGGVDTVRFAYDQDYALEKATVGGQFALNSGRHTIEVGGGVDWLKNGLDMGLDLNAYGALVFDAFQAANPLIDALADSVDDVQQYGRYRFYIQDRIATPLGEVFLLPSLRYDYYGILGKAFLSPRLSVSILVNEATTVRFAGGRYVQSPGFEKLLDQDNLFSLARFNSLDSLEVEEALHLGASLTRSFGDQWQVKIDGYWKQLDHLITQASREEVRPRARFVDRELGPLNVGAYRIEAEEVHRLTTTPVNGGSGKAYGVEVLVERRQANASDPWTGWISYAYANAEREQQVAGERITYPFDYDRRHTLNVYVNRRLGAHFNVGVTWRYGSGFPYTPALTTEPLVAIVDDPVTNSTRTIILTDPDIGVRLVPDFGNADNLNSARMPDYHRLDMRATYSTQWRTLAFDLYLDLINVYNRQNVFKYRHVVDVIEDTRNVPLALRKPPQPALFREPVYMFPFIPSFGFRLAF